MRWQFARVAGSSSILVALSFVAVIAQSASPARDYDAEIRAAINSAKQAAGFEFQGALVRVCLTPQFGGESAANDVPGYVTRPETVPSRDSWYAEPAKIFDDFYFVGGKIHSAWALTTSEGIILIDTIFPYNSEELIVGGLRKLGLDPTTIKYVLITHAHADHIGGAEILQKEFGTKVVMGGPDWDMVEKYPNRYKTMAPKREIVATDGMKITLGGKTVTVWLTPGHTAGTIAFTFPVLDRGKPVNVATAAGVAFNVTGNTPEARIKYFENYIENQKKMAAIAAQTKATVLISNHSEFDNAVNKNRMLPNRGNGPHPYETGAAGIQNFFKVTQGCARAAQIAQEKQLAGK